LGLGVAHALAEEIGIATEDFDRGERDRIDPVLDRDEARRRKPEIPSVELPRFLARSFHFSSDLAMHSPCEAASTVDELLASVDVEGRAGDRGVRHEVQGQRGDVGGADDAPDRQRHAELLTSSFQLIAQDRR
jgi:hypothetical protein